MPQLIQALNPAIFPKTPPKKSRGGKPANNFVRWLRGEKPANEEDAFLTDFPMPLMSAEGILILAQAHEEEYAMLENAYFDHVVENHRHEIEAYMDRIEKFPEEDPQLAFDFYFGALAHGAVVDREI